MSVVSTLKPVADTVLSERRQRQALYGYYRLRSIRYRGDAVYCPICEASFERFLANEHGRQNVACPRCGSAERHRLQWLFLQRETDLFTNSQQRVLHVAPEMVIQRRLRGESSIDYLSADLSSALADLNIDITDIPDDVGKFDVILCSHVLEHIEDDQQAMSELYRVLKPGGWAILDVPVYYDRDHTEEDLSLSPAERAEQYGHYDHVRIYGADYPDRLRKAGFDVTVRDYVPEVEADSDADYGLYDFDKIHYCEK